MFLGGFILPPGPPPALLGKSAKIFFQKRVEGGLKLEISAPFKGTPWRNTFFGGHPHTFFGKDYPRIPPVEGTKTNYLGQSREYSEKGGNFYLTSPIREKGYSWYI